VQQPFHDYDITRDERAIQRLVTVGLLPARATPLFWFMRSSIPRYDSHGS